MQAIPLNLAIPAAAASLAYLNAKWFIGHDLHLLSSLAKAEIKARIRERRDRLNLFYQLEDHAKSKKTAGHDFIVYEGRVWSYKETYETVLKYAAALKEYYGVKPHEIVGLDFMNCPQYIFLWLALWSLGATPAFINYNLTGKPLTHSIKVSTARLLFVDNEVRSTFSPEVQQQLSSSDFRDGKGPIELAFFDQKLEAKFLNIAPYRAPHSDRSGQILPGLAILIYTSGTTGLPKPAVVSWGKIAVGAGFEASWMGLRQNDRFYTCMPIYHTSAAVLGFGACLMRGSTCVIGRRFSTKTFWPEVRASKATVIQYVGETLRYLLAAPPQIDPNTGANLDAQNDVRIAFGNGLRPDIWERFKTRFGVETIAEFYGATEGSSASWNFSSNTFGTGAVGRNGAIAGLVMGATVAIVQLDHETEKPWRDPKTGFCKRMPRGEPGELLYKLDPADISAKFQGYFNNASATESKVIRDVFAKGDAWFRTGDVQRWDNEGRWFFTDRIGDTFRWKSENVSTNEVSEVLGTHRHVHEANVYGVTVPHHDGRAGCAAVLFDTNPGNVKPDLLENLARHAIKSLPKFAVPLFLRVVKEVQTTGNNKQLKHILRGQGVDPTKTGDDRMFWLRGETYLPFGPKEWEELSAGRARL